MVAKRVVACAEGAAIATGCRLEWGSPPTLVAKEVQPYVELRSNCVLTELYAKAARSNGKKFFPKHFEQSHASASSDMGNVSQAGLGVGCAIAKFVHPMAAS